MAIIVIGGGQAAASCVAKYRALGGEDELLVFGDEAIHPYQRPPLSKKYLAGELELERLLLRAPSWYADNGIKFSANTRVSAIDRSAKRIKLADGTSVDYHQLVLATGSRPRLLPEEISQNAAGIYPLRSLADVDAMRPEFQPGRKLLVIGGGYIGLEVAAIGRQLGLEVILVEAAERILQRVASSATADCIRELHLGYGVDIREGQSLERLRFSSGRVCAATLSDTSELAVDFVIVGIGITSNDEIAQRAGLQCQQGILIDEYCRSSDPSIYAAGDCTRFVHQGEHIRIESVGNAIDQGQVVAANLLGAETKYEPKPWFWSDQYQLTLQIAGLNNGYNDTVIRPGAKAGSQSVWYYRDEQLIAVDALGDPRAYMLGRRIINSGKNLPKAVAADAAADLKKWL